jgi:hypothetical protein
MKIYAKLINERGKIEGIGSDKELTIELSFKSKQIGRIRMVNDGVNPLGVYYYPITETTGQSGRILLFKDKGERQKGEKRYCEYNPLHELKMKDGKWFCEECNR